jgi:peptidoglycan/xylan/chitin deacetylase (PgdA/CDA1 family)
MWDWLKSSKNNNQSGALILMYHRVTSLRIDPWKLAVSPANFKEQLSYLKENHNIIALSDLHIALKDGIKNPIVISFDDGYADNYFEAMPILEAHNAPASFFICTGKIGTNDLFWWDCLQYIILNSPVLPRQLSLPDLNNLPVFDLAGEETLSPELAEKLSRWAYPEPPTGKRCTAFLAIWEELKKMPPDGQIAVLNRLKEWSDFQSPDLEKDRAMTAAELKKLSANPLFTIGAHTVNHPQLSLCSTEVQRKEISNSRDYLERLTGNLITHFAYPYGDYNKQIGKLLKAAGFTTGLTTADNKVNINCSRFEMGRYLVEKMTGKDFEQAINNRLQNA